jgi:hypothetical protein
MISQLAFGRRPSLTLGRFFYFQTGFYLDSFSGYFVPKKCLLITNSSANQSLGTIFWSSNLILLLNYSTVGHKCGKSNFLFLLKAAVVHHYQHFVSTAAMYLRSLRKILLAGASGTTFELVNGICLRSGTLNIQLDLGRPSRARPSRASSVGSPQNRPKPCE